MIVQVADKHFGYKQQKNVSRNFKLHSTSQENGFKSFVLLQHQRWLIILI